ncbi:MAG: AAA family ATPase [Candidatus Pacebacteria bacterium]|nr:AAA family ATPase [Candidatus Paceibacterota bacterium]
MAPDLTAKLDAGTPEDQDGVDVRDIRFARADTLRPTVEQAHALELIADFIRDPDARMNSLVGYAGVGKTTLLENIARYALGQGMRVQAVAPVNKAVNRITEFFEKSNLKDVKTSTLHKLLYKMSDDVIPRKRPRDITPAHSSSWMNPRNCPLIISRI